MRRDMDLIRLLLLQVEGEEKPELSGYSDEQIFYHRRLLIEADLVHGELDYRFGGQGKVVIDRLTWEGHEFLDAARNDSVWNKARDQISKLNVSVTLPLMMRLLTALLKDELGLN